MSLVLRKPEFCICENKDADQLRGNREADQHLCFRYTDSTIPLLSKSNISSLLPSSVAEQPGLCRTWSETPKTGFLTTRLKLSLIMRKSASTPKDQPAVLSFFFCCCLDSNTTNVYIWTCDNDLSLVVRYPVFEVSDQV